MASHESTSGADAVTQEKADSPVRHNHNGETNVSVAVRRRTLDEIFTLPLRIVYSLPRPLRDNLLRLKQPFQDGVLDLYSQQVCELLESYETYSNEKLEREKRAEKRSLFSRVLPNRRQGRVETMEEEEREEDENGSVDNGDEEEETQDDDNEDNDNGNDDDWRPRNGARAAAVTPPVEQPPPPLQKTLGKKRIHSDLSSRDIQLSPAPGPRKRGRPKRAPAATSAASPNKRPKEKERDVFGTHSFRLDATSSIGDQLNILRRQLTASLLVLETIQLKYDDAAMDND